MSITALLDPLPIWGVFALIVCIILFALEFGYQYGLWVLRKSKASEKHTNTGTIVGASLGLLAFMLAFTFGSVTSRYDTRKDMVVQDANDIGTAFLRADFLSEPRRTEVQELFRVYVDARVRVHEVGDKEMLQQVLILSDQVHEQLWAHAVDAAEEAPTPITNSFSTALNAVFDTHQIRLSAFQDYRLPDIFWAALITLAVITMVLGGYGAGIEGERRNMAGFAMAISFAVVLDLVVVLDRPFESARYLNQKPMIDLQSKIGKPESID